MLLAILFKYLNDYKSKQLKQAEQNKREQEEEQFVSIWTNIFKEHATIYNGLYNNLVSVATGKAKKPEKVISEWCKRTHYKWEGQEVDTVCQKYLVPLSEEGTVKQDQKWINLLLKAMSEAGLTHDEEGQNIVLSEQNVMAYIEWDEKEIYAEDTVNVMRPAWYQAGRIIEQGLCTLVNSEE